MAIKREIERQGLTKAFISFQSKILHRMLATNEKLKQYTIRLQIVRLLPTRNRVDRTSLLRMRFINKGIGRDSGLAQLSGIQNRIFYRCSNLTRGSSF